MDWSDIFDTKSMIASLLSGGFVLFLAWLYSWDQRRKSIKKLRTLIYYEIFLLNGHLNDIINQLEAEKNEWYRNQLVPGMVLTVYQNSKIQESLIDLNQSEVLGIIRFYNFYLSIENKLRKYCEHLQDKMAIDLNYNTKDRITSFENLLIEMTDIISNDFKDLDSIYNEIKEFEEFKSVVRELDLSS
jgi:hypothetical protein